MGRVPTGQRKYEIEHIWDIHREIVRRLVLGQKPKEIAKDLGVTPQTVSNVRNSSIVQEEISRLSGERDEAVKDVKKMIEELAPKAVMILGQVLESEEQRTSDKIRAATDILDRAGYGAVRKEAVLHAHLSPEQIREIRERGELLAQQIAGTYVVKEDNNEQSD